jgi:protein tyrosine phosphatase
MNQGISDPEFSIFGTVRRLREQRFSMVQTIQQYQFIYDYLLQWLKGDKLIK